VINPTSGGGLASNSAALAAFNRAADTWKNYFSDNVTINISADLFGTWASSDDHRPDRGHAVAGPLTNTIRNADG
jgi:hypothetical protein